MPHINGQVEFLSIKELAKPDNYENTHRASIKIGDKWYSYGTIKKDKVNIKTGDSWTELAKGMEVEFMFDQNGDFANIKKKTFSITDASGAVASAPVQQQAPSGTNAVNKGSFVNPATVGACLNLAIEVLGYKKKDFEDEAKLKEAILWHKTTFDKMLALYPTVDAEEGRLVNSAGTVSKPSKPTPVVEDGYDDEV